MLLIACLLAASLANDPDPHRQFDFWIGEWSVHNRDLQPDGTYSHGDDTRARITPVIDGQAILEEWAGPLRGRFMNGFSLRAFDPAAERWSLLLFWTTDGNAGFGRLDGGFRHGRGEFLSSYPSGGGTVTQRYTFSDALANTVRWDSATSRDEGQTWHTDWIMEFTRTGAAADATEDRLFAEPWTEGELSPHRQARELDWMLGEWRGTETRDGVERAARLRCKLLNKDCLVLDSLEIADGDGWDKRVAVRGFVAQRGAWESWSVSERDTRLVRAMGRPADGLAVFERVDPASGAGVRERLERLDRGGERALRITTQRFDSSGGDAETLAVNELTRAD